MLELLKNPMTIIWIVLFVLVILIGIKYLYDGSKNGLKRKVKKLGNAKGKSFDEIAYQLGTPDSTVRITGNKIVRRWNAKGYEVAFTFNHKNVCTGMTEEQ